MVWAHDAKTGVGNLIRKLIAPGRVTPVAMNRALPPGKVRSTGTIDGRLIVRCRTGEPVWDINTLLLIAPPSLGPTHCERQSSDRNGGAEYGVRGYVVNTETGQDGDFIRSVTRQMAT